MYNKLQLIAVFAQGLKSQAFHSYLQISYMQKYVEKIHCLPSLAIANAGHTHTHNSACVPPACQAELLDSRQAYRGCRLNMHQVSSLCCLNIGNLSHSDS